MKAHAKLIKFYNDIGRLDGDHVSYQFPDGALSTSATVLQDGSGVVYSWLEPSDEELRELKAQQARQAMGLTR